MIRSEEIVLWRNRAMIIEDLTPEYEKLYFVCLEDWSEEMKEAGDHKEKWYGSMKDNGLKVKIAKDDTGTVGGMIQYIPIEHSFAEGKDLYFVNCIWVHGHKEGRGNFQNRGMGKALLKAAEEDARIAGKKGLAAWGLTMPFWMKASWYREQGYETADRQGMQVLLWKPFDKDACPPGWIRRKKKPESIKGKVCVSAFSSGWCPAQNIVFERAKKASAEFPGKVVFQKYDTSNRSLFLEWGISDALFVDKKEIWTGPPPSYDKIRKIIARQVRKLGI